LCDGWWRRSTILNNQSENIEDDDNNDVNSDKDDSICNDCNDQNKYGHRGGNASAIEHGNEMVMMKTIKV
jgi:hypothetical protein